MLPTLPLCIRTTFGALTHSCLMVYCTGVSADNKLKIHRVRGGKTRPSMECTRDRITGWNTTYGTS